jgi:hypothetical protein
MGETQTKLKKIVTLLGYLETSIIIKKPFYKKWGCWVKVVGDPKHESKAYRTRFSKLTLGTQQPTILNAYRGYIKISCVNISEEKAVKKIERFLQKRFLGCFTAEGFGRVSWKECTIEPFRSTPPTLKKQFKIRKGLGTNYPKELQRLLIALMLHDFVHTDSHDSKIFYQIDIHDKEIRDACLEHHSAMSEENQLHSLVQFYDNLASFISRKKPFRVNHRYNIQEGRIDFQQLKSDLEQRQSSAYKLYHYIYHSAELSRLVESFNHGNTHLRDHLLLMVNCAINDYYDKKLVIKNGKIKINIKETISSLASESDDSHDCAKNVEMHSSPAMSTANSERTTTSLTRRLGT